MNPSTNQPLQTMKSSTNQFQSDRGGLRLQDNRQTGQSTNFNQSLRSITSKQKEKQKEKRRKEERKKEKGKREKEKGKRKKENGKKELQPSTAP
jgi:hypothetical protein